MLPCGVTNTCSAKFGDKRTILAMIIDITSRHCFVVGKICEYIECEYRRCVSYIKKSKCFNGFGFRKQGFS